MSRSLRTVWYLQGIEGILNSLQNILLNTLYKTIKDKIYKKFFEINVGLLN